MDGATVNLWAARVGEAVLVAGLVAGAVLGAYHGARRQMARSMAPLVGDPPEENVSRIPLSRRIEDLIAQMARIEDRQIDAAREADRLREDLARYARDLDGVKDVSREHAERIGRLERRADNVERVCGMRHRADSVPALGGGGGTPS
ncbi:MAG TPA: hypothetical protein PK569_20440 [Thermoanaerobaculia bacterium]|mgnify:FL=1|nr:hypothetical protein [Thermoanaerobaculia bacterium]